MTPVFREVSDEFRNRHLQFVKTDVGRQPLLEDDLKIDAGHACANLPIFLAFKGGCEVGRYPHTKEQKEQRPNEKFSKKSIVKGLELVNHYALTVSLPS